MAIPADWKARLNSAETPRLRFDVAYSYFRLAVTRHSRLSTPRLTRERAERDAAYRKAADALLELTERLSEQLREP